LVNTKEPTGDEANIYEMFDIKLQRIKMQYYPRQKLWEKVSKSLIETKGLQQLAQDEQTLYKNEVFDPIEEFTIGVLFKSMVPGAENTNEGKNKPRMGVNVDIPAINLKLKPSIYKKLVGIGALFASDSGPQVEMMENERTKMLAGHIKMGTLHYKDKQLGNVVWRKYFCIFKGSYLYLFDHPTDHVPITNIYLRNATVIKQKGEAKEFAFSIRQQNTEKFLGCDDEKTMNEWIDKIGEKLKETKALQSNVFEDDSDELVRSRREETMKLEKPPEPVDPNIVQMKVDFTLEVLDLKLLQENGDKIVDLKSKNFSVDMSQTTGSMAVKVKLQALEMEDFLFKFTNPNLEKFITSIPPADRNSKSQDLIEVQVKMIDKTHPKYSESKTDMQVLLRFGYLFVNFKPDVMSTIMKNYLGGEDEAPKKDDKPKEKVE